MLLAHPEIAGPASRRRALHHFDGFCARAMTDADVAAYHKQFPRSEGAIAGEWTGRYMADPWTPPLLRRAAPEAKLLVMLSDPIERYRAVFTERLANRGDRDRIYMTDAVDRRCFGAQLARLLRFFDREQVLVLQFERCSSDPAGQYRRTLEFLGVRDTAFAPRGLRRNPLAALLRRGLPAGRRRRVVERVAGRPAPVPSPLWPELERALHTALDPDVEVLRGLVPDIDLALWPNFVRL
jgi:hypothetical protein